jgi:hypothetical protein
VLQEPKIPVEVAGRQEKSQNSDKQGLTDLQNTPTTEQEEYESSYPRKNISAETLGSSEMSL